VVSLAKKEAEVAVGRLHTRVRLIDLELRESVEPEVEDSGVKVTVVRSPGIELDLRGRRVEEGLSDLESYLDAAYLANLPFVRIIHGKGTGRMKEAVRKTLGANSHVSSWEEGKDGEGGAGVTVVKFAH
jgi:DNA mismatch repair protein MutS2